MVFLVSTEKIIEGNLVDVNKVKPCLLPETGRIVSKSNTLFGYDNCVLKINNDNAFEYCNLDISFIDKIN